MIMSLFYRDTTKYLPIVKCYYASDTVVILEDLTCTGHEIVSKPLSSDNHCSLDLEYVDLIVRKSAIMHAASLGTDWLQVLPNLSKDGLFEGTGTNLMFPRITNGIQFVNEVLKLEFAEAHAKFADWITTKAYAKIVEFVRPSKVMRNVLCHGDIWENNIMFRFDESHKVCKTV